MASATREPGAVAGVCHKMWLQRFYTRQRFKRAAILFLWDKENYQIMPPVLAGAENSVRQLTKNPARSFSCPLSGTWHLVRTVPAALTEATNP